MFTGIAAYDGEWGGPPKTAPDKGFGAFVDARAGTLSTFPVDGGVHIL